jgi:hypothetical protein
MIHRTKLVVIPKRIKQSEVYIFSLVESSPLFFGRRPNVFRCRRKDDAKFCEKVLPLNNNYKYLNTLIL